MLGVLRYKLRLQSKHDLYFLCKYIIGFKDMVEKFHRPWCNEVQKVNPYVVKRAKLKKIPVWIRNRLWLLFRGSFKTSIISVGHTIQLLLLDKNLRISLSSNKLDNAKQVLFNIKQVYMLNVIFRFLFPEFCPQPSKSGKMEWGTSEVVTLPNRTDLTLKEGSIECAGVDTGLTSRHYDFQKKDDLVTEKSVTTEALLQASIDWDRLSISLFDIPERGFQDWNGSRYDDRDMYGHLLKRDESQLNRYIVPCFDKHGEPVFKPRFTKEGLERIREEQGEYIFSCQYLLDPVSKKDQKFKPEWFEDNTYQELPRHLAVVIFVDPANARKKSAKYTAIIAKGFGGGKSYWLDAVFDKLSPTQRCNAVFAMAKKWRRNLREVSYETIGFQETDKAYIETLMEKENFFFHIREIPAQEATKIGRIAGLVPFYEYGKILLPKTLPYFSVYDNKLIDIIEKLKYELFRYPYAEHLDLLDAESQQLDLDSIAPTRMVHPSFDTVHIIEPDDYFKIPYNWEKFAGLHFGFNRPTVCLLVARDPKTKIHYVYREYYRSGASTQEHAAAILSMKQGERVRQFFPVLPDEAEREIEEYMKCGISPMELEVGEDIFKIQSVDALVRTGKLKVFRYCGKTIEEFETYRYPVAKQGKVKSEVPIEEDIYCMKALQQVIAGIKGKSYSEKDEQPVFVFGKGA